MAGPDPQALSELHAEQLRESVLSSLIQQYGAFSLWGIQPYLSSLDYAEFLERRGGSFPKVQGDFDAIAEGFASATGRFSRDHSCPLKERSPCLWTLAAVIDIQCHLSQAANKKPSG